jgi:hypothetical protein
MQPVILPAWLSYSSKLHSKRNAVARAVPIRRFLLVATQAVLGSERYWHANLVSFGCWNSLFFFQLKVDFCLLRSTSIAFAFPPIQVLLN